MENGSAARLYLIASTVFFTLAQSSVKMIPELPAHEIVFLRSLISGLITFAFIRRAKINPLGHNRRMLILRGLLGSIAMLLYFWTIQNLPLASAMSLHYLYPIFTVIMAAAFMRERTSEWQWACLGLSFVGVLMIKGFDLRIGLIPLVIALTSALFDAGTFSIIRALRNQDHALVVIFYLPLMSLLALAPYTLTHFTVPSGPSLVVIAAIGIFAQAGQYCVTRAYQLDRASNIANLNYLAPLCAVALGYLIWNETISALSFIGILIIAASASLSATVGVFNGIYKKRRVEVDRKL